MAVLDNSGALSVAMATLAWYLCCCRCCLAEPATSTNATSNEQFATQLISKLMASYGSYGRHVHPGIESNSSFQVNMSFQILHLYGLNENEILEIGVWASFIWHDPRLVWDSQDGRLSVLKVPADKIWLPDVGLSNTKKDDQFDFRLMKALEALVYPNGSVYVYYNLVTSVACPVDVAFFPFDSQTCLFQMGPWTSYRGSYHVHLPPTEVRTANISKFVSEWNLVSFGVSPREYFDENVQQVWDYFEVTMQLRRKPYYYIFVIVLPFFMLSITACLVFLVQETGDRVNTSIAILLTMTLYIVITSSSSPRSMQTIPLLGIYIMVQMAVLILFTFVAIRWQFLAQPPDSPRPAGRQQWATRLDIQLMSTYIGLTLANVCICMVVLPVANRVF